MQWTKCYEYDYDEYDEYDYMATACGKSQLYFYNKNGNYLNKNIQTVYNPFYVGLDSKQD
jgi:hypothetical protein